MVLKQTLTQGEGYKKELRRKAPIQVAQFIRHNIDLDHIGKTVIMETFSKELMTKIFASKFRETPGKCIVNLMRINNIRYINKYFELVNENLQQGGYLIGCVETSKQRRERILRKFPIGINKLYYVGDYVAKRVWPKLPVFKKAYFHLTKGKNRVISKMETFGRLFSCGFNLIDTFNIDGKLYFIAKKVKEPAFNMDATYGPLIKLRRVGKNGKLIKVYKMRTMYPYSEYVQQYVYEQNGLGDGAKLKNDPRITTAGRIFRRYWIDELPMLINLLRGDVKIFGVRPISQHFFSLYPPEFQEFRSKFKPGLIPPVYVEIPNSVEDTVAIENRYLETYERLGILADIQYLYRFIKNILFKKVRSK